MATLTGNTIASTYTGILSVSGAVGTDTVEAVTDGAGTSTSLSLSQQRATITLGSNAGDDFIVDGTTLVVEGDNNRVGIGTNTPSELLHLKSSTSTKPVLRIENANADNLPPYINLVKSTTDEADSDYLGVIGFKGQNSASEEIEYAFISAQSTDVSDGTEDGRINFGTMKNRASSGATASTNMVLNGSNLGIGTTDPSTMLEIEGAIEGVLTAITLHNSDYDSTTSQTVQAVEILGAVTGHGSTAADMGSIRFGKDSNYANTTSARDGHILFLTSLNGTNSEKMRITSEGKVGIGATSPAEVGLTIASGTGGFITLGRDDVNDAITSGEGLGAINFDGTENSGTSWQTGAQIKGVAHDTWADGSAHGSQLIFSTTDAGTPSLDPRMCIYHNGNVGIGTTSPDSNLEISSSDDTRVKITDTGDTSELILRVDGSNTSIHTNTNHDLNLYTNGNTNQLFLKQSNGHVGIGTAEPLSPLHIKAGYNHIIDIVNSTNPTYTISWTSQNYNRIIVLIDIIGNDATTGGDPKGMRVSFALEGDNFDPTDGASLMDASDAADGVPLGEGDDGGGLLFFECWGSDMDDYDDTDTNELDFTATIARSTNDCVATLNFTDWAQIVGRMTVSSNVAAIVAKTA